MIPSNIRKLIIAFFGIFGVTSFLYGAGYLVIHSRMAYQGIGGIWTADNSAFVETGGRFFISLLLTPLTLVYPLSWKSGVLLLILALASDSARWIRSGGIPGLSRIRRDVRGYVLKSPASLLASVAIVFTCILLKPFLSSLFENGPLALNGINPDWKDFQPGFYGKFIFANMICVSISYSLLRLYWQSGNAVNRSLICVQLALATAGLAFLPIAFGRTTEREWRFPQVYRLGSADSCKFLLLDQGENAWMVWSQARPHFRIWPKGGQDIAFGPSLSIFVLASGSSEPARKDLLPELRRMDSAAAPMAGKKQGGTIFHPNQRISSLITVLGPLLWPGERITGSFAEIFDANTKKSDWNAKFLRVYLVNVDGNGFREWPSARGGAEPTLSPYGNWLFYRRGVKVIAERLAKGKSGVHVSDSARTLNLPDVQHLYACTGTSKDSIYLWVQAQGSKKAFLIMNAMQTRAGASIDSSRSLLKTDSAWMILERMKGAKPDGRLILVRNESIYIKGPGRRTREVASADSLDFTGFPSWLPGTSQIMVNAEYKGDH